VVFRRQGGRFKLFPHEYLCKTHPEAEKCCKQLAIHAVHTALCDLKLLARTNRRKLGCTNYQNTSGEVENIYKITAL
jgi:hypothetical protein